MVLNKVDEIVEPGVMVAVVGDFNSDPSRDTSYSLLTNSISSKHLIAAKDVSVNAPTGPDYTKNRLEVGPLTSGEEIDHIFLKNYISSNSYKVIPDYEGEYYPSDHFPVLAVISF